VEVVNLFLDHKDLLEQLVLLDHKAHRELVAEVVNLFLDHKVLLEQLDRKEILAQLEQLDQKEILDLMVPLDLKDQKVTQVLV
jgi:hypothetical protein